MPEWVHSLSKRRLALYVVAPFAVGSTLLSFYFWGDRSLQNLVAPLDAREYGALEALQLAILAITLVLAIGAAREERVPRVRWAWIVFLAMLVFLIGEEIDWGAHYYDAWTGEDRFHDKNFNLHNRGRLTK